MIKFDNKYFTEFKFTTEQIRQYYCNAVKDLKIAKENQTAEVKFTYSYNALIKGGIAVIAKTGKVKIRSIPGHHIKILEKMSEILKEKSINGIGNSMRMRRNEDFYGGGIFISEKESVDYFHFVEKIFDKIKAVMR